LARILLGWELGAGRGHAVRLAALERALAARGHVVIFAVQQIGSIAAGEVWQAPGAQFPAEEYPRQCPDPDA
jgi:UDP:flavonoid glycosyltransferase YjiC (YdhE family)